MDSPQAHSSQQFRYRAAAGKFPTYFSDLFLSLVDLELKGIPNAFGDYRHCSRSLIMYRMAGERRAAGSSRRLASPSAAAAPAPPRRSNFGDLAVLRGLTWTTDTRKTSEPHHPR